MSVSKKKDIRMKGKTRIRDESRGVSVGPFLHTRHRTRNTEFRQQEILERAELYKDEYNQEDIHDRVLILQVMPDDYEIRELTARLELNASYEAENCLKSKVHVETDEETSFVQSSFPGSFNVVYLEEKAEPELLVECGEPRDGRVLYSNDPNDTLKAISYMDNRTPEVSDEGQKSWKPYNAQTNVLVAGEFGGQCTGVGFSNDNETGRNSVSCDEGEKSPNREDSSEYLNSARSLPSTKAIYREEKDEESIRKAHSMPVRPIPQPRSRFREVSEESLETTSEWYDETGTLVSVESGSSVSYVCDEKPDDDSAVCRSGTGRISLANKREFIEEDCDAASARGSEVLREHRIFVHASWLAVNSSYFRSLLFESGMQECANAEFRMKVSEFEEEAFLLLLRSIYDPDVLDNLDITQLMNVIRLSVKFDARFPSIKARRVLETLPLTLEICETIIEAVNSGGLPDLGQVMKNVEVLLLSEFEPLDETWESEKFATLSEHALCFILGSDRLIVQSENTVFIALMKWIETNVEQYKDISTYSDLLNLVRFDQMKPTYIHDVVREHEVATQLDDFDAIYLKAITNHALPPKRREACGRPRQWCQPKTPTFTWILFAEPEMFSFDEETSSHSTQSSSFWYFGYKMHLCLDLSTCQDETSLYLVVENLGDEHCRVELAYDVDVKFGEGLHKSFTCERLEYRGKSSSNHSGNYPFDDNHSVDEIRELLFGGPITVPIMFEITLVKILDD